jgi:hypothetical protein
MFFLNDTPDRRFGVEIEFFCPTWREIERIINQGLSIWVNPRKIPAFGSRKRRENEWQLTTAPSVKNLDGTTGFEINSPPLQGKDGFRQIDKILKLLKDSGALVDTTCGLHVHLEVKPDTEAQPDFELQFFRNLLKLQLNLEDSLDCLVNVSRRYDNDHCQSNLQPFYYSFRERLGDEEAALWTVDGRTELVRLAHNFIDNAAHFSSLLFTRYLKLNIGIFPILGTVEIRHHHGSIEFNEIANWILLQMALIEKAKSNNHVKPASTFFNGPQKAFTTLSVNKEVIEYYSRK